MPDGSVGANHHTSIAVGRAGSEPVPSHVTITGALPLCGRDRHARRRPDLLAVRSGSRTFRAISSAAVAVLDNPRPVALVHEGRLRHLPALDGMRAIAVLMVMGSHMLYGRYPGGFLGVDVFFSLSGFLITALLLVERDHTGRVDFRGFYARRGLRLLPALFGAIALSFVFYLTVPATHGEVSFGVEVLATMFYVINWIPTASVVLLSHAWSLAVEEQFYLLWPAFLAMLLAARKTTRQISCRVATVLAICFLFGALARLTTDWDVSHNTIPRLAELMVGCLLAIAAVRGRRRAVELWGHPALALPALPIIFVLGWFVHPEDAWLYCGGFLAVVIASTSVIAHSFTRDSVLISALSWRPLRFLGVISYGIYLYHWPISRGLSSDVIGLGSVPTLAIQVALTLILATLSFRYLEAPIRRLGKARIASTGVRPVEVAT